MSAFAPADPSPLPLDLPRATAARLAEVKTRHSPELVDRLARWLPVGDPAADSLAESFSAMPGGRGWRMLDSALAGGSPKQAPAELAELVAPTLEPPAWVDLDMVDAGALAYWRIGGINLGLALTCGSLAFGYRSARLTRPLAATGRLTRMAPRRLQETSHWVAAATRPGALRPGGDGLAATVRLRLVHALVRRHLLATEDWDREEWGVPISALDTYMTAIGGFLTAPIRALQDLGVRFSPAELEALTHQWAWIASLMGVPEELLPGSYEQARDSMAAALDLEDGPGDQSAELMQALLYHGAQFPYEDRLPGIAKAPARAVKARVLGGFARRWMEPETADRLGVPNTPLTHLATVLRPLTLARELARAGNLLGSDERIARFELAMLERVSLARFADIKTIEPEQAAREPVLDAA